MTKANSNEFDVEHQREAAQNIAVRFKREAVPIRNSFIASSVDHRLPPLAQLVQSGRGWDVRLRVYLTLLWGALPPSYTVALGAAAYAQIAGVKGARQVRSAVKALVDLELVEIAEDAPGKPYALRPLDESGDGRPYTAPYEATARRKAWL